MVQYSMYCFSMRHVLSTFVLTFFAIGIIRSYMVGRQDIRNCRGNRGRFGGSIRNLRTLIESFCVPLCLRSWAWLSCDHELYIR